MQRSALIERIPFCKLDQRTISFCSVFNSEDFQENSVSVRMVPLEDLIAELEPRRIVLELKNLNPAQIFKNFLAFAHF